MRNLSLFYLLLLTGLVAGLHSCPAFAWGAAGHRIIGRVAEQYLGARAQSAVREILGDEDIASASVWADEMRGATDNPDFWASYAASWHFVNVLPGQQYSALQISPRGDAYLALQTFAAILAQRPVPDGPVKTGMTLYLGDLTQHQGAAKAFALRFMLHILGDLQQPLHSGYAADRGGNSISVQWFGEPTNLHSVWDSLILAHLDQRVTTHARRLEARINRLSTPQIRQLEQSDPLIWIEEARQMLPRIYAAHARTRSLGSDYAATFTPTVEDQLIRGGLRTARYLNLLFGD